MGITITGILVSIAISTALSVGTRLIASLFASPQQASFGGQLQEARDPGATITGRFAAWVKNIVFGTTRVQGNIVFAHCTDNNRLLHLVIEWAGHRVSGYGDLYFNDEIVSLSGGLATGKYAGLVGINDYLGTDDQVANANLIGYAPDKWTPAHRGRGVAYSYINLNWDRNKFPQSLPNIWRVVKGMPLYDPRTGTTAYSENAALAIAAWLNNARFGRGVPYAEIYGPALEAAANICDEEVTLANGSTEKRFTCNGVLKADTAFVDNLEKILSASLGRAMLIGGDWVIEAAAWKEPEFPPFELKDFREGFSVQTLMPKSVAFNAVKGAFRNPARLWQKDDFPAITSAAYQAEDGGDREFKDVYLEMTNSATMAQRLGRIDLRRARQPITFTAPLKLKGMRARVGDVEIRIAPSCWCCATISVAARSAPRPTCSTAWCLIRRTALTTITRSNRRPAPRPGRPTGQQRCARRTASAGMFFTTAGARDESHAAFHAGRVDAFADGCARGPRQHAVGQDGRRPAQDGRTAGACARAPRRADPGVERLSLSPGQSGSRRRSAQRAHAGLRGGLLLSDLRLAAEDLSRDHGQRHLLRPAHSRVSRLGAHRLGAASAPPGADDRQCRRAAGAGMIGGLVQGAVAKATGPWAVYAAGGLLIVAIGLSLLYRDALKDLGAADQKIEQAAKANAGLLQAIDDMREFQNEVRKGFTDLREKVGGLQSTNTVYRGKVASDAGSNAPLTPAERDALGVLFGPDVVRAGAGAPIRGTGAPR